MKKLILHYFITLGDSGGSTELIINGKIQNVLSDGTERPDFCGLAFIEKGDSSKKLFCPRFSKDGMKWNKHWYDNSYKVGPNGDSALPNCATYASDRFSELNGQNLRNTMKGRTGFRNAEEWYSQTILDKDSTPKLGALIQLCISYIGELKFRKYNLDTNSWGNWDSLFINNLTTSNNYRGLSANQGRILNEKITAETNRATGAESTLTTDLSNEVTRAKAKENELNTKFANYLLKSDAPGYADILTKTLASTTYVNKDDAPGYADILTTANASTTYETKNHASETYPTKTEMTNAINSAIGAAINDNY